jgi:hypothetical protein
MEVALAIVVFCSPTTISFSPLSALLQLKGEKEKAEFRAILEQPGFKP